jgi:hypothetical protein
MYPYGYVAPVFAQYTDLNKDPEIINRLTKYFYYKTLDLWLYDDLNHILKYLHVSGSKVDLVKSLNNLDSGNDNQSDTDKKIEFIEKTLFNKDDMYKVLKRLTSESGIGIIELPKNEYLVKEAVKHYLRKMFKEQIAK